MNFDLIGIIYIGIVLLFIIIGFARGLIRTLASMFKGIFAVILAVFLSMPVAKLVAPTKVGGFFSDIYENKFFTAEVYQQVINAENKDEVLSSCIEANTKLPQFINDYLAKIAGKAVDVGSGDQKVAEVLGYALALYTLTIIAFFLIIIVVRLLLRLLKRINDRINKKRVLGPINRLLGALFSLIIGVFFVCIISYALTFVAGLNQAFSDWLDKTMKIGEDTFTLSKFIYNHNFIGYVITWIQTGMFK